MITINEPVKGRLSVSGQEQSGGPARCRADDGYGSFVPCRGQKVKTELD